MARTKSIAEMRDQLQRVRSTSEYLKNRDVDRTGRTGRGSERFMELDRRAYNATKNANRYASRILGRTTYNALSYSRFNRSDIDNKQYTSRFYMSRASG